MTPPTIKQQLKQLILDAISANYSAESCQDRIVTGNHYQSLQLGETRTQGFRTPRLEFLSQIEFKGRKVLDIGSNLGELSRTVRQLGARLVDGFEYDPYFIEIANLVNAHNDVTRVSFHQRDATDPAIYREHYDIVLAFSVFTYASRALEQIAAITDELFVLETHKLEKNLEHDYIAPVARFFPHYRILGESEWGTVMDPNESRAVVVFAKDASKLPAPRTASATP